MNQLDFDRHVEELLRRSKETMREFSEDYVPFNIYTIYRGDLIMPPEKVSAQLCHAAGNCMTRIDENLLKSYRGTGNGTKVVMRAKNLNHLLRGYHEALKAGLVCSLIIDRGHVLLPDFDGNPVITALGIGPIHRPVVEKITKRFTMVSVKKA